MKIKHYIVTILCFLVWSSYAQVTPEYLKKYSNQISDLIDNAEYELAQKKIDSLIILSKQINYTEGLAESYNLRGSINRDQSNLRDALDNFLSAIKLFEELKMPVKVAGIQNNIGLIYAEIKEYRTALAYYFKAEKINLAAKQKSFLAINYNNIATCYQKLQQFSSAQTYLNKSLALRQEVSDTMGMAMAYHNIGINHQLTDEKDSAVYFFNKSLSYLGNMNENMGHAYNYLELGNTLLQQSKLVEAEKYLLNALRISEANELEGLKVETYKYLSEVYQQKNDYKQAFTFQNLYMASKEKIESDENKNEILKKELEYDFSKKQAISNAEIQSQKKLTTGAVIALIILSGLILIVFRSYNQKRKANDIISKQKELVEHKNKEILDSINYAKYIQNALLPSEKVISDLHVDCFILFKPKDIVSGDFYWIHNNPSTTTNENEVYIAAVDCTGHGVPGALVSVVGNNGLNRCVKEFGIHDTGEILDKLSELVEETFAKSENELKDGMDISLLKINSNESDENSVQLQWSGANNPIWIIKNSVSSSMSVRAESRTENKEIIEVKADKQPVGKFEDRKKFTTNQLTLQKGDRLYLFTDGYADQFGGPKGKKFKYRQLEDLLMATADLDLHEQKQALSKAFDDWRGNHEQVDDVCIIGIRL